MHDIEAGNVVVEPNMTLRDYITRYAQNAKNKQVDSLVEALGVDRELLENLLGLAITEANINDYGRFDDLVSSVDKVKAREYFQNKEGKSIPPFKVNMRTDALLRRFLLEGGFDIT